MTALWRLCLLPIIGLTACCLEPAKLPIVASVRPGTYSLRLCRVVCDASHPNNIIESGFIVLDAAPIRPEAFPQSSRRFLTEMTMLAVDNGEANGC